MNVTTEIAVRPLTTKELAALYGLSTKTLRTWLLPHQTTIGKKVSRYYTALQIKTIYNVLGYPN
jgi:DNA-binding transcriptional MerR regulator